MGQINDILTDSLKPMMTIIVYKDAKRNYYLERRIIENGKMQAGVPLSEECISGIMETMFEKRKDSSVHGIVPTNLLFADSRKGHEKYVWYRKPEKRMMYFAGTLDIPNGEMFVPGLLYVAVGTSLAVYAFKGRKPKSKLYRAPFFNVDSTHVCLGNAKVEKPSEKTFESIVQYWEKMFWGSEFVHLLGGNPVKGNLATLTKHCIQTGCKFPEDKLIPVNEKMENILKMK